MPVLALIVMSFFSENTICELVLDFKKKGYEEREK